jgi:hypothetical protein
VVEKEPEKQRPGRPKGSTNYMILLYIKVSSGDAMEVDSEPSKPSVKQPRQATLSFGVIKG